ncbi:MULTISPECIES: HPr family phosphocarrier protein [unclassified Butyrivibrio]|jgi:phosphocarrier protein|uniref:HPr family phosphocarrier protein n=1 Tax=unclassified Butyrivibrio TaxID=2639466 RepID=UPI0003B62CFE|nr:MULTISPECIES: HPr family phosphocarrier protein [unclassified Butyrivibrio]MBO6197328.1 HPr family phosphocarrier protein [Butyrivibrio sp.]MBP3825240.1 HPr family phosphocarrier protein [Butyrivibrio sp.]
MVSQKITVTNEQGMHMRPASVFSQAMTPFASDVKVVFNGTAYDAKSVMMLMSACIKCGAEIEIQCDGADEQDALKKAIELVESGLGD